MRNFLFILLRSFTIFFAIVLFIPDTYDAVPGCGAIYRLVGDGSHSPTFTGFNKSSSSGDYVNTLGTVNLVTFLYDGISYWYNIVQPA